MTKSQHSNKWTAKNRKRLQVIVKPKFFDAVTCLATKCGKSKNQFVVDAIIFYTKYFELMSEEEVEERLLNIE